MPDGIAPIDEPEQPLGQEIVPAMPAGVGAASPPAVPADTPVRPQKLASEKVIVAAPMSFTGITQRIWKMTKGQHATAEQVMLTTIAVILLPFAWALVLCWYVIFGLLLVPYRLLRRGSRKRKRQALQHREMLDAIERKSS